MELRIIKERISCIDFGIESCHFCDGAASLKNTWTPFYWVECDSCGAQIGDPYGKWESGDDIKLRKHKASAKRAVLAWNTRVK